MTAVTVIDAVRRRLGDIKKERWSDETLLLYVSLCQNDICMFTNFYRKSAVIELLSETYVYDLPTDCMAVNRFEYAGKLLPVETRNSIDAGTAQYPLILKDNLPYNQMEFNIGPDYRTLTEALESMFGVTIDAEGLLDLFGVVSDVTTGEEYSLGYVTLYYTATPALLAMVDSDLPTDALLLPDIWFQAFLHFVCAMALQDDNDANNIQRGELEATKYVRVLAHIQKSSAKDFTSNIRTKLSTGIRRV